jgi:hypothetical protein
MHILIWTAAGLMLLGVFIGSAMLAGHRSNAALVTSAFIVVWLIAALYNFYDGWANHGIPFVNEVAAFVPIFGIPAVVALLWSRYRAR